MLEIAAESPASGARFVGQVWLAQDYFAIFFLLKAEEGTTTSRIPQV